MMTEPTRQSNAITVATVSQRQLLRLGLERIVESHRHLRLVGEATTEAQAETVLARERPQVMIIEMASTINVPRLTQTIKASAPTTKILLICGCQLPQKTWEVLAPEIDGMVLDFQPATVLVATIDHLCPGADQPIQDEAARDSIVRHPASNLAGVMEDPHPTCLQLTEPLTERERDIIALAGQGLSNKDIAHHLGIACITVRHHLTRIFDKLGVTSRQKLLIRAHEYGLVTLKTSADPSLPCFSPSPRNTH